MNRYVINDLKDYGDHLVALKFHVFFAYFRHRRHRLTWNSGYYGYLSKFREACEANQGDRLIRNNTTSNFALRQYFAGACQEGHRDLVKITIKYGYHEWSEGLEYACRNKHFDLIEFMIKKGASGWNRGLIGACNGGHRDLVDLMISKGADDLDWALYEACWSEHTDLIKLMIEKGATQCYCERPMEEHLEQLK